MLPLNTLCVFNHVPIKLNCNYENLYMRIIHININKYYGTTG